MPWFAVDDGFHSHLKAAVLVGSAAGREALGLWAIAGSWCAEELTDGFVPLAKVGQLGWKPRHAALLVKAGLWVEVEGGYRFHQWTERNPSREKYLAQRAKSAARQRKSRVPIEGRCHGVTDGVTGGVTDAVTDSVTSSVTHARTPQFALKISDQISDQIKGGSSLDLKADPSRARGEGREKTAPPPLEIGAATEADARAVSQCWHRSMQLAGYTSIHGFDAWRRDYETIAVGCLLGAGGNAADAAIARAAVCAWFWIASSGPIASRRVSVRQTTPRILARLISSDLEDAQAWWLALTDAERRTLLGGAPLGETA